MAKIMSMSPAIGPKRSLGAISGILLPIRKNKIIPTAKTLPMIIAVLRISRIKTPTAIAITKVVIPSKAASNAVLLVFEKSYFGKPLDVFIDEINIFSPKIIIITKNVMILKTSLIPLSLFPILIPNISKIH